MIGLRLITAAVFLTGCAGDLASQSPEKNIALLHLPAGQTPVEKDGACWASDTTPAVIETVTEHLLIRPEQRDDAGNVTRPAEFETKTAQRLVQDREMVWFAAPCAASMTVDFIASLQRALKARGRYLHAVTGVYDPDTAEAVRKLQAEHGLDSAVLALDTALDLGLASQGTKGF
jgi:hypothetical protein